MTAHALALTQVEFHGDTLFAVERDGAVFIAVKPICARLGIAWHGQFERLKRDAVLKDGIRVIRMPSLSGDQDTTCLRLDLVHGWLFTIDEGRVKDEETRQRVLLYKRECYRALFSHFFGERGGHHDGDPLEGLEGEGVLNVRTASASEDFGPLSDLSARCRMVEITERLSGKSAARALWRHLGLPWVGEMDPSGAILAEADDAVARFAVEGIERVRGVVTPAAMLWPAFAAFCKRHDLANPGENSFLTRFGRMGFAKRKVAGRSVYQNIRPCSIEEGVEGGAS